MKPNARLLWNLTPNQSFGLPYHRCPDSRLDRGGTAAKFASIPPGTPANPRHCGGGGRFGSHHSIPRIFSHTNWLSSAGYKSLSLDIAPLQQFFKSSHCGARCAFVEGSRPRLIRHSLCRRQQDERRNFAVNCLLTGKSCEGRRWAPTAICKMDNSQKRR